MRALRETPITLAAITLVASLVVLLVLTAGAASAGSRRSSLFVRTLDGSDNNPEHPHWGQAGALYLRVGRPNYADGVGVMVVGPSPRAVSDLLEAVGINVFVTGLSERQYKNDEQIDNTLRSILFQLPKPGVDPSTCGAPVVDPRCFSVVSDLGAIDIQRARDHGMPSYNDMRRAYGLAPKHSFTAVTGESTDQFPSDPLITGNPINDPNILDFTKLLDSAGAVIPFGTPAAADEAVVGIRRSTLAARLRAVYGTVDSMDAFVGMMSERHLAGSDFGELQLAIWKKQFANLRDGDRVFYQQDPVLRVIHGLFGVDYRRTLSEIVKLNTGVTLQPNVFVFAGN